MALVVKDRVKETTTTTGTGTVQLSGAVPGFRTFLSALSNGDTTYYAIVESSTGAWEVGLGTFSSTVPGFLARTTILSSSNSGSAINLTSANAEVFITQPAGKSAYFDASGNFNATTATTLQTARTINGVSFNGSANITITASTPSTLTRGSYLTGSNFNGSAATTWAVDATSANTASKVVARDASGNFSAGTITAALSGNATTATTLQTARTINGVSFNGSANITITANTPNTLTRGSYLTGNNFNGSAATTWAVDATSANTASKVVARDASGNFSAGTITATLSGNASTATDADKLDGQHGSYYLAYGNFTGTPTIGDGAFTVTAGSGLTGGGQLGTANQTAATSVTVSHADTSSQASVNNSNGTVIQDVTLDTYGHVTGLNSVDLDGRYYTETEINTFIDRSYVSAHSATNLAVGWYTIAQNTGDRAVARFALWDTQSSKHQAVIFYAAHHFGTDSSNTITVLDNSYFSGNPFRYIRIKDGGTYDGAAVQVYIDDASNAVNIAIVGDNVQSTGWSIVDFLPDASAPSEISNWASFTEASRVDLNQIAQGGFATTGPIYADGDTTQYRVFNDNYHPNADTLTTARTINGVSFNGSANITITANTPNTLTRGSYLTGSNFNGSAATTWAVDATSANTASKVVARDASGNFSAGTITAALSGNATTATTLATARTINGVSFNGSANITITASTTNTLTRGSYLTGNNFNGSAATTWAVDATSANTASKVVARDASGNFSAGTITAALSGNATTATTLQTARTINGVSFNGSANITVADSTKLPLAGGTMTGVLTFSGSGTHIAMQEDHYVFRRIDVVDEAVSNSSTAYVLLCANAANNDVNGTITMDRTSGLRHASSCDIVVSAGTATTPVGTCRSMSTAGSGTPTYELVTLTYSSTSYVALKITNPDNYYETSGAYFTGRVSTTAGANELIFVAPANVSSVSAFGSNESHQINGNNVFHDGYHPNADTLTTARTINGVSFNGSANITITANTPNTLTRGSYLTGNNFNGSAATTWAVDATSANTASKVVARDASGNFSAGTIYATAINATTGVVSTQYVADYIVHTGDSDTYMQFHAADQWRVVTGGAERFEINNSDVTVQSALKEKYVALSGTTPSIDVDAGGAFSLTTTGNTTFTFSAFTSSLSSAFILQLTAGGAHTITWPASVDWAGGTAPDAPGSGETNIYVFWSRNGGTTWYGVLSSAAAA